VIAGVPRGVLGLELEWIRKADLRTRECPEADGQLIALLTAER
jgi:hypothetical protein